MFATPSIFSGSQMQTTHELYISETIFTMCFGSNSSLKGQSRHVSAAKGRTHVFVKA
jgi:hypothetical protein